MTQQQDTTQQEELLPYVKLMKEFGQGVEFNLSTEEDVARAERFINELIANNFRDWASDLLPDLMELHDGDLQQVAQSKPELYKRVDVLIAKAQWFLLEQVPPEKIESIMQHHFEFFFDYDWTEVDEKTRAVLLGVPSREGRDALKAQWYAAIESSTALVSDDQIQVNGSTVNGTVQQWFADFKLFLGEREIDPLLIIEYLGNAENPGTVSEEVRQKIEGLFQYDEILHRSSLEPNGAEEQFVVSDPVTGHYMIFDRGETRDTEVEIPKDELEKLRYEFNLDDEGKPMPFAHQVQTSPLFLDGVESRYEQPVTGEEANAKPEEPTVDLADLTSPPTQVVPLMDQEVEAAAAPEEITVVEPVLPDERLVPPPPAERGEELPTMQLNQEEYVPAPVVTPLDEPVPVATPVERAPIDYNALARDVLDELKLLLPSLEMEKRFLSVLSSYFRGVRDGMEAQETLRQTEQEGGVNLPPEQIQTVMQAADSLFKQAQQNTNTRTTVAPTKTVDPIRPTLDMVQKRLQSQQIVDEEMGIEQPTEEVQDIFSNVNPIFQDGASAQLAPMTPRSQKPQPPRAVPHKKSQRMMSPLDELRGMDSTEFRRLADTPDQAAEKILNMINLLAEESLAKKADGVAAWKASELHKQYVEIGNRSLESGKPVATVITEFQGVHADTLSQEEFDAIADMNKMIRF